VADISWRALDVFDFEGNVATGGLVRSALLEAGEVELTAYPVVLLAA
jgi:hypothetical protein